MPSSNLTKGELFLAFIYWRLLADVIGIFHLSASFFPAIKPNPVETPRKYLTDPVT